MKIRKGVEVRVASVKGIATRYFGRTGVVLKKSRDGFCEVKFPDAHRITPLNVSVSNLEA